MEGCPWIWSSGQQFWMSSCGHVSHQPLLRGRSSLKGTCSGKRLLFPGWGQLDCCGWENVCAPLSLMGTSNYCREEVWSWDWVLRMALGGTRWSLPHAGRMWRGWTVTLLLERWLWSRHHPLPKEQGEEGNQTLILLLLTLASLLGDIWRTGVFLCCPCLCRIC